MNRRDFLKFLGIGTALGFVGLPFLRILKPPVQPTTTLIEFQINSNELERINVLYYDNKFVRGNIDGRPITEEEVYPYFHITRYGRKIIAGGSDAPT